MPHARPTRADLARQQRRAFLRDGSRRLRTTADAERFLERVGLAFRYQAPQTAPLASFRLAVGSVDDDGALRRSIELTNHLLASGTGIEVLVFADRPTLVHASLMPAVYALVRRGRRPDDFDGLSLDAQRAWAVIRQQREASAGEVRRALGLRALPRHDPAYLALAELQRALLVDRGPFLARERGIAYLPAEGYPYHPLADAHPEVVASAAGLSVEDALDRLIGAYLRGAVLGSPRTLAALVKRCAARQDTLAAIERLTAAGVVWWLGGRRGTVLVWRA